MKPINESVQHVLEEMGVGITEWWEESCRAELSLLPVLEEAIPQTVDLAHSLGKKAPYIAQSLIRSGKAKDEDQAAEITKAIYDTAMITPKMVKKKMSPFLDAVTKWVMNGSIKLPEDSQKTRESLEEFNRQKVAGTLKGDNANINTIERQQDLFKAISDKQGLGKSLGFEEGGAKLIPEWTMKFEDGEDGGAGMYKVYRIDDHATMQKCGSNSNWCVVHEQSFNQYKPPYFLITRHDDEGEHRVALAHRGSMQLKAEDDSSLLDDDPGLFQSLRPILNKIFGENRLSLASGDLGQGPVDIPAVMQDLIDDSGIIKKIANIAVEVSKAFYTNPDSSLDQDDYEDEDAWDAAQQEESDMAWDMDIAHDYERTFGTRHAIFDDDMALNKVASHMTGYDLAMIKETYDRLNGDNDISDQDVTRIIGIVDNIEEYGNKVYRYNARSYRRFLNTIEIILTQHAEDWMPMG